MARFCRVLIFTRPASANSFTFGGNHALHHRGASTKGSSDLKDATALLPLAIVDDGAFMREALARAELA
jgi:hypothetical protein